MSASVMGSIDTQFPSAVVVNGNTSFVDSVHVMWKEVMYIMSCLRNSNAHCMEESE